MGTSDTTADSARLAMTAPVGVPSRTRRIGKQAMIEKLGAKLKNVRWSWDATMPDGSIVFIGWSYRAQRALNGEVESCEIYKLDNPNHGPGGRERGRHIAEVMSSGAAAYLVLATPKDQNIRPHEIDSVDDHLYTVSLEKRGEFIFARVIGSNSTPDVRDADLAADVKEIESSPSIADTEKPQLIQARRGQGIFRTRVELLEVGCRVTGVKDRAYLRASHIKPWRVSSNAERLDGSNGMLLAPHVDHLFDRGFISFGDDGALLRSPRLDASILAAWGLPAERNVGEFSENQRMYLSYHRSAVLLP